VLVTFYSRADWKSYDARRWRGRILVSYLVVKGTKGTKMEYCVQCIAFSVGISSEPGAYCLFRSRTDLL